MRRITALGSVAASSTDYAAYALDQCSVPAVPQQLLASYYAQGADGDPARGGFCHDSAKFLAALDHPWGCGGHITKYLVYISDLNDYCSYHLISKHLESVDTTHLEAQLCLTG